MFVSYLVVAFNQEKYIEQALNSALSQTYEPMEIVVTDDCSTDGTAGIIEEVLARYSGPKKVTFLRHPANRGLAESFNHAFTTGRGDVYIASAGDDVSLPHRTATLVEAFRSRPDAMAVHSNAEVIDGSGVSEGLFFKKIFPELTLSSFNQTDTSIHGATAAYRRGVFHDFGPLNSDAMSEDRILSLRAAILGRVVYLDLPLVRYRRHGANLWFGNYRTVATFDQKRAFARKYNHTILTILRNRLSDIQLAMDMVPDRRSELMAVQRSTRTVWRRAELENRMYDAARLPERLKVTAAMLTTAPSVRYLKKWAGLFLAPAGLSLALRRIRGVPGQ